MVHFQKVLLFVVFVLSIGLHEGALIRGGPPHKHDSGLPPRRMGKSEKKGKGKKSKQAASGGDLSLEGPPGPGTGMTRDGSSGAGSQIGGNPPFDCSSGYPPGWGPPPIVQDRMEVGLYPASCGCGSGALRAWILENLGLDDTQGIQDQSARCSEPIPLGGGIPFP